MQKFLCVLFYCCLGCFSNAQRHLPTYPQVLEAFFKHYTGSDNAEDELNFAKKRDGWYVQQVNRLNNDQLLSEHLFWSLQQHVYQDLTPAYKAADTDNSEQRVVAYLNKNNWYDYERCCYYGYNGWADDIINDYGGKVLDNDTLYESLGRAYSFTATLFLWYQAGGAEVKADPLRRKLDRLELPGKARIDKVRYYIDLAKETYTLLEKRNPQYKTKVGNVPMKRMNEAMFGYDQMVMAGEKAMAKQYIAELEADDMYINLAKNYLSACAPNAILFTFGDNDTYPLWYVQEKLNFRKDVTIINNSLLGLAVYAKHIREVRGVNFSIPNAFLAKTMSDYSIYQEGKTPASPLTAKKLIADIVSGKSTVSSLTVDSGAIAIPAYKTKKITVPVLPNTFSEFSMQGFTTQPITVTLSGYLLLNDLLTLDIVASNINARPIYFTSEGSGLFDAHFIEEGIIYRLVPLSEKAKKAYQSISIKKTEEYISKQYLPLNIKGSNKTYAYAGGQEFYHANLFYKLANFYANKKNLTKASEWMDKGAALYPQFTETGPQAGRIWGYALMLAGKIAESKQVLEQYAQMYVDAYAMPNALQSYITKEECISTLEAIKKGIYEGSGAYSEKLDKLLQQMEQ